MLLLVVTLSAAAVVNNAIDIWFDRSDPTLETLNSGTAAVRRGHLDARHRVDARRPSRRSGQRVARRSPAELERLDGVSRVISPTSLEVLQEDDAGSVLRSLDAEAEWPPLARTAAAPSVCRRISSSTRSLRTSFSLLIKEHTGPSTPGTVRQQLVSEVRRVLDTHPAVAASAVAGTAVINADLNRLSWGDFLLLIPGTVVVASLVLLAMLRFRWRTTVAILTPVGLTTAALIGRHAALGPAVHDGDDRAARVCASRWDRLQPARHELDRERGSAKGAAPPRTRRVTPRASWPARPSSSHVTTALGFGLLAVIPVTPVQEMALFGAAGELLSGLHVLFVLPMCLYWFGATGELASDATALRRRTPARRRSGRARRTSRAAAALPLPRARADGRRVRSSRCG